MSVLCARGSFLSFKTLTSKGNTNILSNQTHFLFCASIRDHHGVFAVPSKDGMQTSVANQSDGVTIKFMEPGAKRGKTQRRGKNKNSFGFRILFIAKRNSH